MATPGRTPLGAFYRSPYGVLSSAPDPAVPGADTIGPLSISSLVFRIYESGVLMETKYPLVDGGVVMSGFGYQYMIETVMGAGQNSRLTMAACPKDWALDVEESYYSFTQDIMLPVGSEPYIHHVLGVDSSASGTNPYSMSLSHASMLVSSSAPWTDIYGYVLYGRPISSPGFANTKMVASIQWGTPWTPSPGKSLLNYRAEVDIDVAMAL